MGKIFRRDQVNQILEIKKDKKVVLCGGCFDIFHYGHLVFLQAAKKEGDILCVQLESDEFIKNRKKRSPVHTQAQRAEIIAALEPVDVVITLPFFESDIEYGKLVADIKPAIIAVTEGDAALEKKKQHAAIYGAEVRVVCPAFHSFSSSNIGKYEGIFGD